MLQFPDNEKILWPEGQSQFLASLQFPDTVQGYTGLEDNHSS